MDPVSKLARTLGIVRRAAAPRSSTGAAAGSSARNNPTRGQGTSAGDLYADIARRLSTVSPQDANGRDTRVRLLLQQILLHEFGSRVLASQGFNDVLDRVQAAMEADPAIRAELDGLIEAMSAN
jgi:hypothetical protein